MEFAPLVTHRPKRLDRLWEKIQARHQVQPYQSFEEIYHDIVDLAGVRIALYFPGDEALVERLVQERFDCQEIKRFSGSRRGSNGRSGSSGLGYRAVHYHVTLRPSELEDSQTQYALATVEIQVATIWMHAWAEVEHDLRYKPPSGVTFGHELTVLDEMRQHVQAGELALIELEQAIGERPPAAPFGNHYELAGYLRRTIQNGDAVDVQMITGRADILFRFLQLMGANRPDALEPFMGGFDPQQSIARQVTDRIIARNPARQVLYWQAEQEMDACDPCMHPLQMP